jgi:putative transposase
MNSIMERWIQSCRHELLDDADLEPGGYVARAARLRTAPQPSSSSSGIANARPLYPLPEPITDPAMLTRLPIRRHDRLGGLLREYHQAA